VDTHPKPTEPAGPGKATSTARLARYINTGIAVVLTGLSIYHYTQPNQAWRSGTAEICSAAVLIAAAYLFPRMIAMAANILVAIVACGLGIRHLIHGGGWRSGTVELLFAVLLVVVAVMIYWSRREPT
jgi:hypothetical protein